MQINQNSGGPTHFRTIDTRKLISVNKNGMPILKGGAPNFDIQIIGGGAPHPNS